MFRRVLIPVAVLFLIGLVVTALSLVSARRSLLQGVQELHLAQDQLSGLGSHSTLHGSLRRVRIHVVRAGASFRSADARLGPLSPLLTHLAWFPVFGGELAAAPPVARVAVHSTDGALSLLDGLQPLVRAWDMPASARNTPALVRDLAAGRPQFDRACRQFEDARRARREVPGSSYPRSLASALRSLDGRLPRLAILCRALALGPSFLGEDRPVRYLIVYQNVNELRATGGFIGSAGLLTLHRGRPSQEFHGTGIDDNLSVPPPEPVQFYNGEPGWLFRDSNWSPDFPTTAALERFFYKLDFHRDVPNVIDLTARAAADILSATGPVYVPEYRRSVSAGNVAVLADYYAHWSAKPGPLALSSNGDTNRKQFIGIVARRILERLTVLPAGIWVRVGEAVASAVTHEDLLVSFGDEARQALVRAAGAAGAVTPRDGDYLYVVDTNLSYNKINQFVHLSDQYHVTVRPNRWLDARLAIHLTNLPAPPAYKRISVGPQAGRYGSWDDYATFLRIYTPPGAQLVDQSGWTQPWSAGPAYGGTMFSGYLIVPHGGTRTIQLHYVVPPNVFTASRGEAYSLLAPHQPGSHPDRLSITVDHDGTRSSWTVQHPTTAVRRTVSIESRHFDPIPLPAFVPPATSPGGWVEPHAFLSAPHRKG